MIPSSELPIPATVIVAPDGTIRLAFVDADWTHRLEPAELLNALEQIATTRSKSTSKFKAGEIVPATTLESVTGEPIKLPDPDRLVDLQFRRFMDCPICNTHIAEVRRRAREIEAAGVKQVIVFDSSARSIRSYQKDVPFALVGDPKKALYKEFGVESSLGFLTFKFLRAAMREIGRASCRERV